MTPEAHQEEAGFSLIEALVALSVLAIATVGLMQAVESHLDSTRGLERRAAAMWVAENKLAELQSGINAPETVEMMGQNWSITINSAGTSDPELRRIRVLVTPQGERQPLASLDGFVDERSR